MSNEISFNSLTIVIVLYRESFNLVSNTLSKIKNFKIIIIDNDNNNDLKKKILSNFKIDQYILNKKNIGFSAGYNQGLKLSTTKFSLVLGPDCIIFEKDIFLLIKKLIKFDNTLIVSPTSYDEKNNLTYAGGPLPENGNKDKVFTISGDVCVDNTLGACMLFRTNDLKEKKLFFDENFFLYFSDDDLCRRVKSMKKSIIQVFDAKCIHQHGKIKVKNTYIKKFIREYNFCFDQLYYFYKINQHYYLISTLKKKIPLLVVKLLFKLILFQYLDAVKSFSKIFAYYKFKRKFLRRDGRVV